MQRNAVFDINWSLDDTKLAVATSGKQAYIVDVATGLTTAELRGHSRTQKTVQWSSTHLGLLCSGDRDGTICLWDVRQRHHFDNEPALCILDAHRQESGLAAVTDILFPEVHTMYSAGSRDA